MTTENSEGVALEDDGGPVVAEPSVGMRPETGNVTPLGFFSTVLFCDPWVCTHG